jgi:hypothetical protein
LMKPKNFNSLLWDRAGRKDSQGADFLANHQRTNPHR